MSAASVIAPPQDSFRLDFREIGDHLYDGVYVTDGVGKTLYVNRSYLRITGLAAGEIIGRRVQDLVSAGLYSNAVTPEVLRLRTQVNSIGHSLRNGARMLITGTPIFDDAGRIKLVVVVEREITDLAEMEIALEATREKMRAVEAREIRIRQEVELLRKQVMSTNLVGRSRQLAAVMEMVERVAAFDVSVLIRGETGVGKEVVANEIHARSAHSTRPFIKVNCAALPGGLLEAELFGYERGAFTGAAPGGKPGMFELADHGTIMLDEIGELPLDLQSKLLRVIEQKEVTRVGGRRQIRLDVRIIAATNRDLYREARLGKFREDLYYRLNVFPIEIPPLRERRDDIATLSEHFLAKGNQKYRKNIRIEPDAMDLLTRYPWPGNVRELEHVIERLVLISEPRECIDSRRIGTLLDFGTEEGAGAEANLKDRVDALERTEILRALERHGSTRKAAAILGMDQSTLVKKAKRLGIRLGARSPAPTPR